MQCTKLKQIQELEYFIVYIFSISKSIEMSIYIHRTVARQALTKHQKRMQDVRTTMS